MKQTFSKILEIVFPMRVDAKIVASITSEDLQKMYDPTIVDEITHLLLFSDEKVRACIHETKFHNNQRAAEILSSILETYILSTNHKDTVVIPIPLSKKRKKSRGHNQVETIASFTKYAHVEKNILCRIRDTNPQTTLSKNDRLKNVADAFGIRNKDYGKERVVGKNILLLDDVFTTGATIRMAKATLLPLSPASITCVSLAH